MTSDDRTVNVSELPRVEGQAGLSLKIREGGVQEATLRIFEPPRFFEAFLRGRKFSEPPDLTSRICGICPVAYQMSAAQAIEDACGVVVEGAHQDLRRLIYCGEWIESHMLHVYLLHAPDFLGYQNALEMAKDYREVVERGLRLKKIGNDLVALLGGREIHPVNVRLGGFHRVPQKKELVSLAERLEWGRDAALETVRWVASFPFPDFEYDYEFVALSHPHDYPINEGRLVSSKGLDIPVAEYRDHFFEEQVPHSTALHSRRRDGGAYLVGPLARYNLNFDRLTPLAAGAALAAGLGLPCRNPFKSIIVRSVETLYACEEALRLIARYEPPERPFVQVHPRAGTGNGCTEAPRGILYHRYALDSAGTVVAAQIVPPTSQNQRIMEDDLQRFAAAHLDLPTPELTRRCEQVIRNYDPCISCSTHFLQLYLDHA